MGEAEASRAFASLYRRKVAPASQTLTVKTVYSGGDTDKYVFELPDGKCIETVCIKAIPHNSKRVGCARLAPQVVRLFRQTKQKFAGVVSPTSRIFVTYEPVA